MPCKDPEKVKQWHREYHKKNADKICARARAWRKNNPDKKRDWDFKQLGWTLELYNEALVAQGGVCAICGQADPKRNLAADHEHTIPPKPRGLLCNSCNTSIGKFNDDPALLEAAAAYLRKYGAK